MEYKVDIYEIQENGRCKADLNILDLNLFIGGFRVVPGINGRGVIVHMPKGMGTDWKYKEIEWAQVRGIISEEYLKLPVIQEILRSISSRSIELSGEDGSGSQESKYAENERRLVINLYNFDADSGDCFASVILPKSKIRIEDFRVKNMSGGGISVYMPRTLGTFWRYDEITWKEVQQKITEQYRKEITYINSGVLPLETDLGKFNVKFHSCVKDFLYELTIIVIMSGKVIHGSFCMRNEKIKVNIPNEDQNTLKEIGLEAADLEKICMDALGINRIISDEENRITIEVSDCVGLTISTLVDFSLPDSSYVWKNFFMKQMEDGTIVVGTPSSLKQRWMNTKYPWNVLCNMLKKEFRRHMTELVQEHREKEESDPVQSEEKEKPESDSDTTVVETEVEKPELSEKRKKFLEMRNQMERVRNAENNAFAFVPHSILKLVAVPENRVKKNLTRQIIYAINDPQGGIGSFEIEILDWVSKLKYVAKTMILDLVLSGYISQKGKERVTATKMTNVMNRLYKYDLIESSQFVSVDDNGDSLEKGKGSIYRVHTLGATGYNLLREMGRHPERRNPFGVLADGNTVKKQLSANQWLIYWLTHYSKGDILDFSINTIVNSIGLKWNGARIYASINLETISIIAEPVRRCEDFEKANSIVEVQEKLMRLIEILDNEDQLYTSVREQIVYPTRPIISFICEDDQHMNEVAEGVRTILDEYIQQEVWFTTDFRMYNYNCQNQRFSMLKNDSLEIIDLEQKIGLKEMTMEERGSQSAERK